MKKNPEKTAATKERLKNAFWDAYSEKPLNKITVREVSQRAGCNRSTFYTYYKDIYDILEQTEDEIMEMLEQGRKVKLNMLDPDEYRRDMAYFGGFLQSNRKCLTVLFEENGDPKLSHRIWKMLRERLTEDMSNADIALPPEMYSYIAEYIINAHAGVLALWLKRGCDVPFETLVDILFKMVGVGVVPVLLGEKNSYEQLADIVADKIKEKLGYEEDKK